MSPRCLHLAVAVLASLALCGCSLFRLPVPDKLPVYAAHATEGELFAGAAAVDITPDRDLYMGGFDPMRKSTGVHDPLYARALVLRRGSLEVALVSIDSVGLMRPQVAEIQRDLEGLDARHVIVCATHVHHSPDTMGMWGFPGLVSGSDPEYMAQLRAGARAAIAQARAAARPAESAARAIGYDPEDFLKNSSRPGMIDPEIVVLHVREAGGGPTIATLVELGCHPEAVKRKNTLITADYPGWTVARLEAELGGIGIYVSGALGALVAPDRISGRPNDPVGYAESERIGERLATSALEAVAAIDSYDSEPQLDVWHSLVYLENENWRYDLVRWTGVVDRRIYRGGYFETEVSLWRVGDLALATVPGEISPDLGLRIKRATQMHPAMIVGLANDELGYLVPPWDYDLGYYDYERTLCVGRDAGWSVFTRLEDLALLASYSRPPRAADAAHRDSVARERDGDARERRVEGARGEARGAGGDPLESDDRGVVPER